MKILRRRVFIRKSEFVQLRRQALSCGYTSANWHELEIDAVAKEITFLLLQGRPVTNGVFFSSRELRLKLDLETFYRDDKNELLARQYIDYVQKHGNLYHKPYTDWSWRFENNRIEIRAKKTCAWQPMGVAVLERIY